MKALIVENNEDVRVVIQKLLANYCPEITAVENAGTVAEGIGQIHHFKPQIVFLDVELPDGTSFDLMETIPEITFQPIFITAHEKYAIKAIKFSALDFLLKPIDKMEFTEAVKKAITKNKESETQQKVQTALYNSKSELGGYSKIVLKDKYGLQIVFLKDIIRLEADGSYTDFYLIGGSTITISKGLKEYLEMLPSDLFFRSHNSHIINMNHLNRYDRKEGDWLLLSDGSRVPLAIRKKDALLDRLANY
ncbi:MAG: LytTR family DNA-binding domain-containing protein [Bacteroidota bacterium]